MVRLSPCGIRTRCVSPGISKSSLHRSRCEDTCCKGWGDSCRRPDLREIPAPPRFPDCRQISSSLVEINPASSSPVDYARMRLEANACTALNEGLCSIQQALGEPSTPDLCSTYPRVLNQTGETIEKSLHLSCPEAARLALKDSEAMVPASTSKRRPPIVQDLSPLVAGAADQDLHQVRTLLIQLIEERSLPLGQRVLSLGFAVDRITGVDTARAVRMLKNHVSALTQGLFQSIFAGQPAAPALQLETVLELVMAFVSGRITPPPGFLIATANSCAVSPGRINLAIRRTRCSISASLPGSLSSRLCAGTEHLLENFLIGYVFWTLFPYRRRPAGPYVLWSIRAKNFHAECLSPPRCPFTRSSERC